MTHVIAVLAALAIPASAQSVDMASTETATDAAEQPSLEDLLWVARPIVVFADTANDPRFVQQMDLLNAATEELQARDVVILTDTDPTARSALRLKLRPRGFQLVLVGKDGQVKLRKPVPWDVREISRAIDKMPLRQQELRAR